MNDAQIPSEPKYGLLDLEKEVYFAIGHASMCWNPIPTGEFDSQEAKKVGYDLMKLIRAALSAPASSGASEAVRQPLTEEQIEHLWDTRVGYPTTSRPLGISDVLLFAREIERAHGITGAQE